MEKTELVIKGSKEKPISLDITRIKTNQEMPVILFCHGFKGFKDWGHFNLISEAFAKLGFVVVKFNFSYNGTTTEQLTDFADLEAFGNNNFSIELDDLGIVVDYIEKNAAQYNGNTAEIYLMGHSRGGGIATLKAAEDKRIKKLATWAAVKDAVDFFLHQDIQQWINEGSIFTFNSRTQQNMPLNYQLYENYIEHKERLDILQAASNISIPWLIVHGTKDSSVPFSSAEQLHMWNKHSELYAVENANHTFGGKHPWLEKELTEDSEKVVKKTADFFLNQATLL